MSKALEALDKIKEALNPYGHYDDLYDTIKYSLLRLESLEKFKATFDNYELAKKQDFIAYENWQECDEELEELKRDVKRYFELYDKPKTTKESNELYVLQGKLLKVGKEE